MISSVRVSKEEILCTLMSHVFAIRANSLIASVRSVFGEIVAVRSSSNDTLFRIILVAMKTIKYNTLKLMAQNVQLIVS